MCKLVAGLLINKCQLFLGRYIQLFENGKALKYDAEYLDDDFGGLSDQPLDIEEFEEFKTTHSDFESIWQQTNRP